MPFALYRHRFRESIINFVFNEKYGVIIAKIHIRLIRIYIGTQYFSPYTAGSVYESYCSIKFNII